MTRKVRLTDYNQRIEVPQGAALFLEGGDIVVDGEIGSEGDSLGIVGGKPGYAPGGGGSGNATSLDGVPVAAASPTPGDFLVYVPEGVWANSAPPFNPTITDPRDGDILARVGGVWVNSGNMKIGASFEYYGLDLAWATPFSKISFDVTDPNVAQDWLFGCTLNDAKDAIVLPLDGRYRIRGYVRITRQATAGVVVLLTWPTNVIGQPPITTIVAPALTNPPTNIANADGLFDFEEEYSARSALSLLYDAEPSAGDGAATSARLYYSLFQVQYVGPATSL